MSVGTSPCVFLLNCKQTMYVSKERHGTPLKDPKNKNITGERSGNFIAIINMKNKKRSKKIQTVLMP